MSNDFFLFGIYFFHEQNSIKTRNIFQMKISDAISSLLSEQHQQQECKSISNTC